MCRISLARTPILVLALAPLCLGTAAAQNIVGWRTDGNGRYPNADPPTTWSQEENIVWKTELPGGGWGSPVVVGDRIFVTAEPAELLCVDARTGEVRWQRSHSHAELYGPEKGEQIEEEYAALESRRNELRRQYGELRKAEPKDEEKIKQQREKIDAVEQQIEEKKKIHAPPVKRGGAGNAAATPVCDGEHVWAAFGHGVASCHTLDGGRRWMEFVEGSNIGFGHASSPVLAGGNLIVHFHDLVALDAASGKPRWRKELPARHATPTPLRIGETVVLLAPSGTLLRASDGEVLADDLGSMSECSAVLHEGVIFAQGGKTRAWRIPENVGAEQFVDPLWEADSARGRRTPSPVYHDGLLYGVTTAGILDVTDAESGEKVYRRRLDLKNVYSSVTSAGDYLFISDTRGTTIVLKPGREYDEIARNEIEGFGSSPVFIGARMYIRARKHLYCIAEQ